MMADLPLDLTPGLAGRLARALDVEGKIPRALDALGELAGRDVVVIDVSPDAAHVRALEALGAHVTPVSGHGAAAFEAPLGSADVVIGLWSAFRGAPADELAMAERLLRPAGRLLVVHDYGRDDVAMLRGPQPEYDTWSRRDGPFLSAGFRIRVLHCWWTFDSLDDTRSFVGEAFGLDGLVAIAAITRPRLSWNVAVYHRTPGVVAA